MLCPQIMILISAHKQAAYENAVFGHQHPTDGKDDAYMAPYRPFVRLGKVVSTNKQTHF